MTLLLWHPRRAATPAADNITDTDILQKPVNVMMAGDLPIKGSGREWDLRPLGLRENTKVSAGQTRRLKGDKPSFKIRTDKRGYD